MLLRSASAPFDLSALVSEGDNDCSSFNKPFAASRIPLLHSRGFTSQLTTSMRRAHSDTDLQGLVHPFTETDDQSGAEKRHSLSKLSILREKEQSSNSISEVNKRCRDKKDFTINRRPCSGEVSKQSACDPPASTSSSVSAQCVHGIPPNTEGERLSPLLISSGIRISSKAEDLIMNVGGDFHSCDGGGGGSGGCRGQSSSPHGDFNTTDLYYQKLLQSDPENPLLLRNYAQFLAEAKHDNKKSQAYYERAILACPNDGEVLSKYAKHVWDVHKDSERAEIYFDRALKATPDDSYVLASHASFLWQCDEDKEDANKATQTAIPPLHETCATPSPLMASA